MIVSYETFRIHTDKFTVEGSCDLLICDEAHRLKNDQTQTNKVPQNLHTSPPLTPPPLPVTTRTSVFLNMFESMPSPTYPIPVTIRTAILLILLKGRAVIIQLYALNVRSICLAKASVKSFCGGRGGARC